MAVQCGTCALDCYLVALAGTDGRGRLLLVSEPRAVSLVEKTREALLTGWDGRTDGWLGRTDGRTDGRLGRTDGSTGAQTATWRGLSVCYEVANNRTGTL